MYVKVSSCVVFFSFGAPGNTLNQRRKKNILQSTIQQQRKVCDSHIDEESTPARFYED